VDPVDPDPQHCFQGTKKQEESVKVLHKISSRNNLFKTFAQGVHLKGLGHKKEFKYFDKNG
jgi:hypothetical protein